jgi:outer membrane protein OmpA-like peptidoglycan-associated protein
MGHTDYKNDGSGFVLKGIGEYFFPATSAHIFGLKVLFGTQSIAGSDPRTHVSTKDDIRPIPPEFKTNMFLLGGAVTYSYSIADKFFPFASAGLSNLWFDPKDDQGNSAFGNADNLYSKSAKAYDFQLGLKYLITDQVSINISATTHIPITDYLDDIAAANRNDSYSSVLLGISFSPFIDTDSDKDGVKNKYDECSDLKEDIDGFEDDDGCPDLDNDQDGISDELDICPDEPEDIDGFEDLDGCPDSDNDRDGILDAVDKCPNDAEDFDKFQDEDGCPDIDNDNDGILDVDDKCPNEAETFNGFNDEDGCSDTLKEGSVPTGFFINADEIFNEGTAKIKYEAQISLNEIISIINKYPDSKWRIEGHMDSRGSEQYLRTLSLERAKAILEYLVLFGGMKRESFEVFGMGDKFPVANNNTEAGRKRNRRIEILRED